MKMTWSDYGDLLFEQGPKTAVKLPLNYWANTPDLRSRIEFLFAENEKHKSTVDAAIRFFVDWRVWSELPAGSVNYLTHLRLMCAVDTINILLADEQTNRIVPDPDEHNSATILNWLLIGTWHQWRWDSFLKLEALRSMSGPDSFYGLGQKPLSPLN